MRKAFFIAGLLLVAVAGHGQDIYTAPRVNFRFFSSAPMEDIEAKTSKGQSALNVKTRAIYFKVAINTFEFKKKLMQEHFNENYLESDKYPNAEFKGSITDNVDLRKDGIYPVTVAGSLNMHGVSKDYTTKGTITVAGGKINASAKFNVTIADHKIKIPSMVVKNIAEVVEVSVNADYTPNK